MCRLLGWVAFRPASLSDVLGATATAAFTSLSAHHADGWGVATAADGGTLDVVKAPTCAALDPRFTAATRRATPAGLAHLRWATPGLPVAASNTHPFLRRTRLGEVAFAHNGALHRRLLADALPLAARYAPVGTTDSERYFLTLAAALDAGADLREAVSSVVHATDGLQVTSLNALVLTPGALVVVCRHDPAAGPRELPSGPDTGAPYFELRLRRSGAGVVVASSGFDQPEPAGWRVVPNGSITTIDRVTGEVDVHLVAADPVGALR